MMTDHPDSFHKLIVWVNPKPHRRSSFSPAGTCKSVPAFWKGMSAVQGAREQNTPSRWNRDQRQALASHHRAKITLVGSVMKVFGFRGA